MPDAKHSPVPWRLEVLEEALEFIGGYVDGAPDATQTEKTAGYLSHKLIMAISLAKGEA